jgi:hypothetical protein
MPGYAQIRGVCTENVKVNRLVFVETQATYSCGVFLRAILEEQIPQSACRLCLQPRMVAHLSILHQKP